VASYNLDPAWIARGDPVVARLKKRLNQKPRNWIESLMEKPPVRYPHGNPSLGKVEIGMKCVFNKGVEIDGTGFVEKI